MSKFNKLGQGSFKLPLSLFAALLSTIGLDNLATAAEITISPTKLVTDSIYSDQSIIAEGIHAGAIHSEIAIEDIHLDEDTTAALYSAIQNADKIKGPIVSIDHNGHISIDFKNLGEMLARDGATKTSA